MDWQSNSQTPPGNPGWYPNYGAYPVPPPMNYPPPQPGANNWQAGYPPYNDFSGGNWNYTMPPFGTYPYPPPVQDSPTKSDANKSTTDVQPPLPPGPPPDDTKKDESKKDKSDENSEKKDSKKNKDKDKDAVKTEKEDKKKATDDSSSDAKPPKSATTTTSTETKTTATETKTTQSSPQAASNFNYSIPPPPPPQTQPPPPPLPQQQSSTPNATPPPVPFPGQYAYPLNYYGAYNRMNWYNMMPPSNVAPPNFNTPPPPIPNKSNTPNSFGKLPVKFNINTSKLNSNNNFKQNLEKTDEENEKFYSKDSTAEANKRDKWNYNKSNKDDRNVLGAQTGGSNSNKKFKSSDTYNRKSDSTDKKEPSASDKDWPQSLKNYVSKCFEICKTELDKDQVEICLKGKLTVAASNGSLWTKNWDDEPLPKVHSESLSNQRPKPSRNTKNEAQSKRFMGDPSRGFTITRRSTSRSRSRSRSPIQGSFVNKRKEHFSRENKDKDFIPFNKKGMRGKGKRYRGRGESAVGKEEHDGSETNAQESYFYSKHGKMTLDSDLSSTEALDKRAVRFSGSQAKTGRGSARGRRGGRGGRGGRGARGGASFSPRPKVSLPPLSTDIFSVDDGNVDWSSFHVIGTSTALEKPYLRLTAAPDPETVRTLETLKLSLEHVKKDWIEKHDYRFACDQIKSIRQDLTVQGVRNHFTIQVYETHCRIALEKGDHEEFNQCQSQLKQLYLDIGGENRMEFTAYRLLYYIYTKNTLDMTSMLASLNAQDKEDECVSFALHLRQSWALSNYHKFFRMYKKAPKMAGYLIDWFCSRERTLALKIIVKSYRPGKVESEFVQSSLAFGSAKEWQEFAAEAGIEFTDQTKAFIDCKASKC